MAVLQPPDFAAILARAPRLNEQGSPFAAAVLQGEKLKAGLLGGYIDAQAQLEATRIAADARIEEAKIARGLDNSFASRLARVAPLLAGSTGSSGSDRFAGQLLAQGLGFTSPAQVLAGNNAFLQQLNQFRSGIEPWAAPGKAASTAALKSFG